MFPPDKKLNLGARLRVPILAVFTATVTHRRDKIESI